MKKTYALAICMVLTIGVGIASAKTLDSVTLRAKPADIRTKIAAVSNSKGKIFIAISTKKDGKFTVRDRDRAEGVKVGDGKVSIEAGQEGASYEKNGGEGLLSVGDKFAEYFRWNAKQKRIYFYN